jgi:hypothetical protein
MKIAQSPTTTEDQTLMTELSILPDGRIFVFGASRGVLEVLQLLQPRDPELARRLAQVRQLKQGA